MSQTHEDAISDVIKEIDIRPLKRLAARLLPEDSMFRRIIMEENDSVPATYFVAKLGTWLSILDCEAK